ncbi:unnamed protein product [Leptidea sinapis]|uniref:Uncharacterized protein n=1 Tax=Leptidea sinapis TaxID=189913 RepID=A0A5E4R6W2_9NEOP|nr:unnamed protein product [Leptidea sinapis]
MYILYKYLNRNCILKVQVFTSTMFKYSVCVFLLVAVLERSFQTHVTREVTIPDDNPTWNKERRKTQQRRSIFRNKSITWRGNKRQETQRTTSWIRTRSNGPNSDSDATRRGPPF